ncbi:MAG: sel1 repeat family protein [Chitinophagaceae bacterium]|nr:sel1 repeat family protein [Chitinophagaceae bacterium]
MKQPLTFNTVDVPVFQRSGRYKWNALQRFRMILFITGIFFLFHIFCSAKDITGTWKGKSHHPNNALEVVMYISPLGNGRYSVLLEQSAKGAWVVSRNSISPFAKLQTVKKQAYGYMDATGRFKVKEISIIENEKKHPWTLDMYHFDYLESENNYILRSPVIVIGNYEMRVELSRSSVEVPAEFQSTVQPDFVKLENLKYESGANKSSVLRYNDSGSISFGFSQSTTNATQVSQRERMGILTAHSAEKVFLDNRTNRKTNNLLIPLTASKISYPVSTGFFDLNHIDLEVLIYEFYGTRRDTFLLASSKISIAAEGFFEKKVEKYPVPIPNERMKAVTFFYGAGTGTAELNKSNIKRLANSGDIKAKVWSFLLKCDNALSDEKERVETLKNEARKGDPEAMFLLYSIYHYFDKYRKERDNSQFLLDIGADNGFPPAVFDKSRISFLSREYKDAFDYALSAYKLGLSQAAVLIGDLYENGIHVKKNIDSAIAWYNRGISKGDDRAMMAMALLYNNAENIEPDVKKSVSFANQAATRKNSDAMVFLGKLFYLGNQGIKKNEKVAVDWFKKAADLKNPDGMFHLGLVYSEGGELIAKDEKSAFFWFRNAAIEKHGSAMNVLSKFYDEGIGVAKNEIASRFWFSQAQGSSKKAGGNSGNNDDMANFLKHADFSPKYYRDVESGTIYSTGPDLMGGMLQGLIGSYGESRAKVQREINGLELMYEKDGKKVYGGTVTNKFLSTLRLAKGDKIAVYCTGSMKLGWALNGITPAGTNGYDNYSIERRIPHGAFMIRIQNTSWMNAGRPKTFEMDSGGLLEIAVNDADYSNNVGYFDFKIEVQ